PRKFVPEIAGPCFPPNAPFMLAPAPSFVDLELPAAAATALSVAGGGSGVASAASGLAPFLVSLSRGARTVTLVRVVLLSCCGLRVLTAGFSATAALRLVS